MKHNQKRRKSLKIVFVMDKMKKILLDVDTSISIIMEAQKRGHRILYVTPDDLCYRDNILYANAREVIVSRTSGFRTLNQKWIDLRTYDIVFNRKEPPFDLSYLYLTQMLELLEPNVFVINSPRGVRKANEKLYILEFPRWVPPTLVSNDPARIEEFQREWKIDLILKPLDQKGGVGIKLLRQKTKKTRSILSQATQNGKKWIMVQKFLEQSLTRGDKRILLLNGNVIGQFGKIPKPGEFRANLSLGGKYVRASLTNRERALVRALHPKLLADGLYFVGIDVIDGWLLEINVTSPAGIPEIDELEGTHPEIQVVDFLEAQVSKRRR